jgi:hypothetical protein
VPHAFPPVPFILVSILVRHHTLACLRSTATASAMHSIVLLRRRQSAAFLEAMCCQLLLLLVLLSQWAVAQLRAPRASWSCTAAGYNRDMESAATSGFPAPVVPAKHTAAAMRPCCAAGW